MRELSRSICPVGAYRQCIASFLSHQWMILFRGYSGLWFLSVKNDWALNVKRLGPALLISVRKKSVHNIETGGLLLQASNTLFFLNPKKPACLKVFFFSSPFYSYSSCFRSCFDLSSFSLLARMHDKPFPPLFWKMQMAAASVLCAIVSSAPFFCSNWFSFTLVSCLCAVWPKDWKSPNSPSPTLSNILYAWEWSARCSSPRGERASWLWLFTSKVSVSSFVFLCDFSLTFSLFSLLSFLVPFFSLVATMWLLGLKLRERLRVRPARAFPLCSLRT